MLIVGLHPVGIEIVRRFYMDVGITPATAFGPQNNH
jgi:hypothetical protein